MTDVATNLPVASWYPDPSDIDLLRWWDGSAWTSHVMPAATAQAATETTVPEVIVQSVPEVPTFVAEPIVSPAAVVPAEVVPERAPAIAIPEPMPFENGVSADRTQAGAAELPSSPEERAARAAIYAKLAGATGTATTVGASTGVPSAEQLRGGAVVSSPGLNSNFWTPPPGAPDAPTAPSFAASISRIPVQNYGPLPAGTPSVWVLAWFPWISAAATFAAYYQLLTVPTALIVAIFALTVIVVLPFVLAARDRAKLRVQGYSPLSMWWMLLGVFIYLIVRLVTLNRQSGKSVAPLVVYLVNSFVAPIAFAAAFYFTGLLPAVAAL